MNDLSQPPTKLPLAKNPLATGLIISTLGLLAIGVVMVNSSLAKVKSSDCQWYARSDARHVFFACGAFILMLLLWRFRYYWFTGKGRWPVLATIFLAMGVLCTLCLYVPGLGHSENGSVRWLRFGPEKYSIGFQPSEVLKISLVVFLSAWLSRKWVDIRSFGRTFIPAALVVGVCLLLVVGEDLGTAVLMGVSVLIVFFLAGIPWYSLLLLFAGAGAGFWVMVLAKPYRMQRIHAMLDPWDLSNPATYQPCQALISILTGGWAGKGLGKGVNKLGYLPEDSTDFIFATLCEEMGYLGVIILLGLVASWAWFAWSIARRSESPFGRLLGGALAFMIPMQMILHVAVALVLLPPTGISFPFVSAGGTGLLIMSGATALLISISAYRDPYTLQLD